MVYVGLRSPYPVMWREVFAILGVLGGAAAATGAVVAKLKRDNRNALALESGLSRAMPALAKGIDSA
jgi:hypothetical protein